MSGSRRIRIRNARASFAIYQGLEKSERLQTYNKQQKINDHTHVQHANGDLRKIRKSVTHFSYRNSKKCTGCTHRELLGREGLKLFQVV